MQVDLPSILTVIPPKLRPIVLRSGAKFQDLKDHIFEKDEVQWVCEEIDKNMLIGNINVLASKPLVNDIIFTRMV